MIFTECIPPAGNWSYLWNPMLSSLVVWFPLLFQCCLLYSPSFPFQTISSTQIVVFAVSPDSHAQLTLFLPVLVLFFISSIADCSLRWWIIAVGMKLLLKLCTFFHCINVTFFWCFRFLRRFQFFSLQSSMLLEQTNLQSLDHLMIVLNRVDILNWLFVFLSLLCRRFLPSIVNTS